MGDMTLLAVSIIESEARDAMKQAVSLEDKFRAAFKVAKHHWMFTDENTQFRGGIGAVGISVGVESEEYSRIKSEMTAINSVNAMLSGVPVDLTQIDPGYERIGIMEIWRGIE